MKKTILLLLLIISISFVNAQKSQNEEISKLSSGKISVHKLDEKKKFQKASKPWPVEFVKSGDTYTNINLKRAGIIDEKYGADLPGYPAYYKNSSSPIVVSVIDGKIYYYTYSIKTGSKIKYILTEKGVGNYNSEKETLDSYRKNIKVLQNDTRQDRIDDNKAKADQLAKDNTLKGKNIKSIKLKLIDPPSAIGMLTIVKVGVEFELTDGTVLKTKNLGGHTPYTDFDSEVKGGAFSGGDFKVAGNSTEIPNDKIEITVWSKFDAKKIKGSLSHPLNYKSDIGYPFYGSGGIHGRGFTMGYSENGTNGKNGKSVNVKAELSTINGEKVNKITITDAISGKVLGEAKLHVNNTISINTSGGKGGDGANGNMTSSGNGGNGGDGGDAGNITLSGSGKSMLKISTNTKGGQGGQGGSKKETYNNSGMNGKNGKNGTLIK